MFVRYFNVDIYMALYIFTR